MSAPAREGPAVPAEKAEKKRLSTLVSRMKTVLKRSDGSKRLSFSSKPPTTTAGPSAVKTDAPTPAPAPAPVAPTEETTAPSGTQPKKVLRSEIDAERARKLGERFRVNLEPNDWSAVKEKEAFRVEKPIRMRIHRQCHRCSTTFGGTKTCATCQHTRCTKCPRYPLKTGEKKGKEVAAIAAVLKPAGYIEPDEYWNLRDEIPLTKPSRRQGGQPLVRKKPVQRVRRTCHECSTLFPSGVKICTSCNHSRCVDCPRDPAKKKKYPDGYPGDQPSSNPDVPIKYACHKCAKVFPPVPNPASAEGLALGDTIAKLDCVRCGHSRCADCRRAPITKVEPTPDPEILKRVEAKLASLNVAST